MYVNVRLHTTMYNILRQDVQQCTTMYDNVQQKLLPYAGLPHTNFKVRQGANQKVVGFRVLS